MADLVIAGEWRVLRTAVPHDVRTIRNDGGKVYTVVQFVPKRGEQVMLEGAEETAIRENVSKEEMDTWVLRSHKRAGGAGAKEYWGYNGFHRQQQDEESVRQ